MKFIILFAFLAFELSSATDIQSQCQRACPFLHAPVCGFNPKTNDYQTFSNECFLGAENDCKKTNFVVKYAGPCKESTSKCSMGCTDDYNPVCARSTYEDIYKTFPNLCSVKMENKCSKNKDYYEVAYFGECQECFACKCTLDGSVCALNYKTGSYQTFPCNCTLEKENKCPTSNTPRDNFEYKYDGECKCSIDCPEIYDPVCAKSAKYGNYQTFSSKCSFQAEVQCNPNSADFVYKYDGPCECPLFCPMNYSPVCAINTENGKEVTFGNQCEMNAANKCPEEEQEKNQYVRYSFLRMGECEPYIPSDCLMACTKEYAPLCACDVSGNCETFANPCLLKSQNECGSTYYQFKKDGDCIETEGISTYATTEPTTYATTEPTTYATHSTEGSTDHDNIICVTSLDDDYK